MNPKSTDYEMDALTITPLPRLALDHNVVIMLIYHRQIHAIGGGSGDQSIAE